MFKRNLGTILSSFSKVKSELEVFVKENESNINGMISNLEKAKEEQVKAGRSLKAVTEILGE